MENQGVNMSEIITKITLRGDISGFVLTMFLKELKNLKENIETLEGIELEYTSELLEIK